jgi:hypothetical protein
MSKDFILRKRGAELKRGDYFLVDRLDDFVEAVGALRPVAAKSSRD